METRFAYLDNMRSLVIFLVIAVHSAVTYSGIGGWYYNEISPEQLSTFEMIFFGFHNSFLQAWLMGILFFISAYLASKALAKHGSLNFIKERCFRLGVPLLLFIAFITPIIIIILPEYDPKNIWLNYATGPLWFVKVLLILCLIYTFIKIFFKNPIKMQSINSIHIIFAIIIVGIIAFFVRLLFPIGTIYMNLQFCFFTSYIVMFIAGIMIGENDLLNKLFDEKNIKWLMYSLVIGIPLWAFIMLFGGALEGKEYYNGGFNWQSFIYALWEALIAIGFSIGLLSLFKKKVNIKNKFTGLVRDNAFGIYFFHSPIIIAVSLLFKNWIINPIIKYCIVTLFAFFISLLFSYLIRKIKPIGIILK
jgi:surface polysaccharide O-acyltransferase-like enzyme